jgi:hypothetical protein
MDQLAAQASMTGAKAAQQKQCAQTRRQQQVATAKSQGLGANPIKILGGEDFPQHTTITIDINGGLFTGHFDGESFHVSRREHPDNEEKASRVAGEQTDTGPESPQSVQWRLLPSGRARSVNWRDAERTRQWEFSLSFPLVVDRLVLQR